ncbi:MAG TPA: glycosyltransferase family 39 protein [Puia sp.]|nr:glycosyltransferase family 39 protein [Puia sp.]
MAFIALILLVLCHLLSGYGLLTLFTIRQKTAITLALALILGVAVASLVPFVLQLCFIPLTPATVFGSLVLAGLLLNIRTLLRIGKTAGSFDRSFRERWGRFVRECGRRVRAFHLLPYEIPFVLILGFLLFVSVWRCYYLPPTSRDALSGPEAIAEYAVREHTMINSFFNVDLWTTNNQFKSPFLISLQIIYKMAGFPFGQIWLSLIFISFTVLLYQVLKEKLHPIIAGLLLLLFTMEPELYAYSFMILYDYSNMVFLFLSLYFLFDYCKSKTSATLYFAGLLMGIATYIRSETLALALFFIPVLILSQWREKYSYRQMVLSVVLFLLPAVIAYYLTVSLYIGHYLPVHYAIGNLVNQHLSDLQPLFKRYGDIGTRLLTGELALHLWGYFMFIWAALFLLEGVLLRRYNRDARNWLYAIGAIFVGLGLLGYLLPLFDLTDTTKRGLFKVLPLMLLYMANNGVLHRLSAWIGQWENAVPVLQTSPGKAPLRSTYGKLSKTTGNKQPDKRAGKTPPPPPDKKSPAPGRKKRK